MWRIFFTALWEDLCVCLEKRISNLLLLTSYPDQRLYLSRTQEIVVASSLVAFKNRMMSSAYIT